VALAPWYDSPVPTGDIVTPRRHPGGRSAAIRRGKWRSAGESAPGRGRPLRAFRTRLSLGVVGDAVDNAAYHANLRAFRWLLRIGVGDGAGRAICIAPRRHGPCTRAQRGDARSPSRVLILTRRSVDGDGRVRRRRRSILPRTPQFGSGPMPFENHDRSKAHAMRWIGTTPHQRPRKRAARLVETASESTSPWRPPAGLACAGRVLD
jgi:hypothetical protein